MSVSNLNSIRVYEGILIKLGESIENLKETVSKSDEPVVIVKRTKQMYSILFVKIGDLGENELATVICEKDKIDKVIVGEYSREIGIVDSRHICGNMEIPRSIVENKNEEIVRNVVAHRLNIESSNVGVARKGDTLVVSLIEYGVAYLYKRDKDRYKLEVISNQQGGEH